MGSSSATKQAEAQLKGDLAASRAVTQEQIGLYRDFINTFDTRNKDAIRAKDAAYKRAFDYQSGKDVSSIFRGESATLRAVADQAKAINRLTGGLGGNALAKQDPRYMAKLQNVAGRQLGRDLGYAMVQAGQNAYGQSMGEALNISQMLSSERQAGLGMFGQGVASQMNMAGLQQNYLGYRQQADMAGWQKAMGIVGAVGGALSGAGALTSAIKKPV